MFELWMTVLFFWLAVVLPWGTARRTRALAAQMPSRPPRALQLRIYRGIVFGQWGMALAVVAGLWGGHVRPTWLGLRLPRPVPLAAATAVLVVAWIVWTRILLRSVREPARRGRLLARFERMRFLLPADDSLVPWWWAVSITAGVCEETLYRGFIGFYLHQWMPMWAAAIVGSIAFAAAHAYQGWGGVRRTGLVGLIFWAVYLVTGSLLPGMVLHAAIDVRSGLAVKRAAELEAADGPAEPPVAVEGLPA